MPARSSSDARPAHFEWNARFLELCGYYRIEPRACRVRRARTKGKVEKPFQYTENHLIKGNSWTEFDAFSRDLRRFTTEVLDVREHQTTHQRPIDRFAEEVPSPHAVAGDAVHRDPCADAQGQLGLSDSVRRVPVQCAVPLRGQARVGARVPRGAAGGALAHRGRDRPPCPQRDQGRDDH